MGVGITARGRRGAPRRAQRGARSAALLESPRRSRPGTFPVRPARGAPRSRVHPGLDPASDRERPRGTGCPPLAHPPRGQSLPSSRMRIRCSALRPIEVSWASLGVDSGVPPSARAPLTGVDVRWLARGQPRSGKSLADSGRFAGLGRTRPRDGGFLHGIGGPCTKSTPRACSSPSLPQRRPGAHRADSEGEGRGRRGPRRAHPAHSPARRAAARPLPRLGRRLARPRAVHAAPGRSAHPVVPRRLELHDVALPRHRQRGADADALAAAPPRAARGGARPRGFVGAAHRAHTPRQRTTPRRSPSARPTSGTPSGSCPRTTGTWSSPTTTTIPGGCTRSPRSSR